MVEQLPPHIQDCVNVFNQNWKVVKKKSYPEPVERLKDIDLIEQVFECGISGMSF